MKKHALIVAGGSGTRMGAVIPKQFLHLGVQPILMHTMQCFVHYQQNIELVIVLPEHQIDYWKDLCKINNFTVPHKVTAGGETRFHSVRKGLDLLSGEGFIAIHDGVRPFVSRITIGRCFDAAQQYGCGIPVIEINESLRIVDKVNKNHFIDRNSVKIIQTPQTFQLSLIRDAYQQHFDEIFTDDASVFESMGHQIHLVEGNQENIKITTPFDMVMATHFIGTKI